MNKPWLWIVLLLSLGVNIGILATVGVARFRPEPRWDRPDQASHGGGRFPAHVVERMANALELEGENRDSFMDIQGDFFGVIAEHRQGLHAMRREFRVQLMDDDPSPERIDQLIEKIGETQKSLDSLTAKMILQSREVLEPQQQHRYFQFLHRLSEADSRRGDRESDDRRRRERRPRRPPG